MSDSIVLGELADYLDNYCKYYFQHQMSRPDAEKLIEDARDAKYVVVKQLQNGCVSVKKKYNYKGVPFLVRLNADYKFVISYWTGMKFKHSLITLGIGDEKFSYYGYSIHNDTAQKKYSFSTLTDLLVDFFVREFWGNRHIFVGIGIPSQGCTWKAALKTYECGFIIDEKFDEIIVGNQKRATHIMILD